MAATTTPSLTPEMESILARIAQQERFSRPRFDVKPGSGPRDGYTSAVYRITISDEDPSGRADALPVIYKVGTALRGELMDQLCAAEDYMYRTVLPAFQGVLGAAGKPLPWPSCYHADAGCLVLADLQPDGFAMAKRRETLDADHCRHMLTQLARYHGAGLALQRLRPEVFAPFKTALSDPYASEGMQELLGEFVSGCLDSGLLDSIDALLPEGSDAAAAARAMMAAFRRDLVAMMCPEDGDGYTVVHGDCHGNNMMFQYDKETGVVTDCCLLDFQVSRYGCPALDLANALLTCTDGTTRAAHWNDLLRGYHCELQDTLRAAGVANPDDVYSWQLFQAQLARASWFGLCMAPLMYNGLSADEEQVLRSKEVIAALKAEDEQQQQQQQQVDGSSSSPSSRPAMPFPVTPDAILRLADLIRDLVSWGWMPTVQDVERRAAERRGAKARPEQGKE